MRDGLRRALSSRPRRLLVVGTVVLSGLTSALALTAAPPAEQTVMTVIAPAQSVVSVLTPLIGILLVSDLRRFSGRPAVVATLLAGLLIAVLIALVSVFAAMVPIAFVSRAPDRWDHVGALTFGSVLVQGVALLTGTGLGMLIRSRVVAFMATIVIPLGLWRLLGTVDALEPARGWLTQYESARRLLADQMTPLYWLQFLGMLSIWGPGLNALGARMLPVHRPPRQGGH